MKFNRAAAIFSTTLFFGMLLIVAQNKVTNVSAQQPTGSIPTVTGTPSGPMATIKVGITENFVNVRSGPSSTQFDIIGIIYLGDAVPVIGKSIGGDWLLVEYPGVQGGEGWIWALYMDITPGEIAIVEMPPTPQPKVTFTIDPTMASQFITTPLATRLPTYTPPPPLVIPTFELKNTQNFAGIPIGFIIILLLGVGVLIALFSYFQAR